MPTSSNNTITTATGHLTAARRRFAVTGAGLPGAADAIAAASSPRSPAWTSAATYRSWLTDAGLRIEEERVVPEDQGGHVFLVASR